MNILIINAGSSSLKYEVFSVDKKKVLHLKSIYEGAYDAHGKPIDNYDKLVRQTIDALQVKQIHAIGHRVVHGGEHFTSPVIITREVIETVRKLCPLAPLHNPANLECILACKKIFPRVPQVAVFDTAFHQTMPEHAYLYALPYKIYERLHVRRYGFHGTSHNYVYTQAKKKLGGKATARTVTCHLGNGCSIAAILNGKVIDTSMGLTPLEGVPMGTRSGDIDPSIIFYLINKGFSTKEVERLLNNHSGLKGLSGISSDVRDVWAACKKKNTSAKRALRIFSYRIAKYIGAYSAALKGLDCIVFTGGIGVGGWYVRKWILEYFPDFPKKRVLVIPTDEERFMAEAVIKIIGKK